MVPTDEDEAPILGACQQSGRYYWCTDLPCPNALKYLLSIKVIQFKAMLGNFALYVPIVSKYGRFSFADWVRSPGS